MSAPPRPHVGFIGLGDQGLPMGIAIAQAGLDLHVWARHPADLDHLAATPHTTQPGPAELAAAVDVLCLCVSNDDAVLALAQENLLTALRPGSVLVNHGTGTPHNAQRLADLCRAHSLRALDAPVSGGRPGAEQRALTTMVGGEPDAVSLCEPVFDAFSAHVVHLGGPGAGQSAKALNNALLVLNQGSAAEIVQLAGAFGLDPRSLVDVLKLGSANSRALELLNTMVTPQTVDHLARLLDEDLDILEAALRDQDAGAPDVLARGRASVRALPSLIQQLNP